MLSVAVQSIPDSMTGTKINSNENHPVAVFAGQECALIPESTCCCDHMEEQLAGVRQWGKHFIASRMPIRNGGAPENTLWQIYASEANTNVTIHADAGVTGIPATNFVLNANQMSEFYATGPASEPGDFEVIADKPIAVYGYMVGAEAFGSSIGDPAMVQMAPVEQYLPRYVVLVPGTWITDVAVVTRPVGAPITMDGVAISDAEFNPVGASGYEVARITCPDGVHVFDGGDSPFQVIIVGYDQHDSYAYLGGTGTGKINPNPRAERWTCARSSRPGWARTRATPCGSRRAIRWANRSCPMRHIGPVSPPRPRASWPRTGRTSRRPSARPSNRGTVLTTATSGCAAWPARSTSACRCTAATVGPGCRRPAGASTSRPSNHPSAGSRPVARARPRAGRSRRTPASPPLAGSNRAAPARSRRSPRPGRPACRSWSRVSRSPTSRG
ncbi:hypothetical protein OV079_39715 [Nannocystis pusilla]|uniref:IgGFc-binding protein N-terminal domain-containing protein n=1 Tax=Nannocystis pusilla TaxID=889268 RepID=A0A9X3J1E9_9BACT|nr:hypothetical protein [Nannocystis pusilla]